MHQVLVYVIKEQLLGQWKDNKAHGKGKLDCVDGSRYTGEWIKDKKLGRGKMVWGASTQWAGDMYEGDYVDDMRTGQGVYIYANGDRYELSYS